jgi:hypothetical protein
VTFRPSELVDLSTSRAVATSLYPGLLGHALLSGHLVNFAKFSHSTGENTPTIRFEAATLFFGRARYFAFFSLAVK